MIRAVLLLTAMVSVGCAGAERNAETGRGSAAPTTTVPAATTSTAPPRDPVTIAVTLDDYAIRPAANALAPGAYQLSVTNVDRAPHDVVLVRTDLDIDELPTEGIRVDEQDPRIDVRSRTSTIEPAGNGSLVATLQPGTYILVCTVPHHYVRDRMAAVLTVTAQQ